MLCEFSRQFPLFVEQFLDRGSALRRRFREETITDLMMGGLITAGGGRVIVEFPDEPSTGADMEWNFVDPGPPTFFRLMLQAKQAYGEGGVWTRHCYRELFHTSGSGSKLQAEALCDTARHPGSATYPLYIFYHAARTCDLARASGSRRIAGVNLVDGFLIERLVKAATNRRLRTSNKSLRRIAPSLIPLSVLFCPPTIATTGPFAFAPATLGLPMYISRAGGRSVIGFPIPPSPGEIRARLVEMRSLLWSADGAGSVAQIGNPPPEIPDIANHIPDDVQAALNPARERRGPESGLNRWRLTFVSARPSADDRDLPHLGTMRPA